MIRLKLLLALALIVALGESQLQGKEDQNGLQSISKLQFFILAHSGIDTSNSACEPNCQLCSQTNPSQCQQCQTGYVLQAGLSCAPCSHGCIACQGVEACVQCASGYLLVTEGFISRCIKCPQGCQTCQALSFERMVLAQSLNCKVCYPGYYRVVVPGSNSIYNCSPCLTACSNCSSSSSCASCVAGFGYNSTSNQCYVCQTNCLECTPTAGCQLCTLGYYLDAINQTYATCSQCLLNCIECSSPTECTRCVPGYYPSTQVNPSTNTSTSFCLSCPPPCSVCYNHQVCLSCPRGYFLSIVQGSITNTTTNQTTPTIQSAVCHPCVAFCSSCYNTSVCHTCQTGYYLSDGQCLLCGSACQSCISQTQCLECMGSYYLSSGVCKPCSPLCSMCSVVSVDNNEIQVCENCTSFSYAPVGGVCTLCTQISEGCLTCTSAFSCLTCQQGYNLTNGQCQQVYGGLGAVYIVLFCIAGVIGVVAMLFGVWACWRHRNGYGSASQDLSNPALRASYYQIP